MNLNTISLCRRAKPTNVVMGMSWYAGKKAQRKEKKNTLSQTLGSNFVLSYHPLTSIIFFFCPARNYPKRDWELVPGGVVRRRDLVRGQTRNLGFGAPLVCTPPSPLARVEADGKSARREGEKRNNARGVKAEGGSTEGSRQIRRLMDEMSRRPQSPWRVWHNSACCASVCTHRRILRSERSRRRPWRASL